PKGQALAVSREAARRGRPVRVGTDLAWRSARVLVPEGKDTIVTDCYGKPTVVATESRIYATYQLGGPSEVRVFDLEGKPLAGPKRPPVSAVAELTPLGGDDLLFGATSFIEPFGQYLFRAWDGETKTTPLCGKPTINF